MTKVLIVEDDQALAEQVSRYLAGEGYDLTVSHSGEDADKLLKSTTFDLLILDWELPGKSGIEICKQFRQTDESTPILFLTGRSSLQDKEIGFDSGADDYIAKPFALQELRFRLKALLRRSKNFRDKNTIKVRQITLEPHKFRVSINGVQVKLLPKEFAVLEFLMRHPGEVFSPDALLDKIWSAESNVSPEAVSVCVRRLRKKVDIDPDNPLISNIHGVGYLLEPG